jgi:hypothetical protein
MVRRITIAEQSFAHAVPKWPNPDRISEFELNVPFVKRTGQSEPVTKYARELRFAEPLTTKPLAAGVLHVLIRLFCLAWS